MSLAKVLNATHRQAESGIRDINIAGDVWIEDVSI